MSLLFKSCQRVLRLIDTRLVRFSPLAVKETRQFCSGKVPKINVTQLPKTKEGEENPVGDDESTKKLTSSVSEGYVPFENRQRVIQDVLEEMWNPLPQPEPEEDVPQIYPRGRTGVFDLPELINLLREENAREIVAIALPKELEYADYMVIVTVRNDRQLVALATFVRKRFKMKERLKSDTIPFLDKKMKHRGWIALDLGNIIFHVFLQETRDHYDLEMLWTVGPLFDDLYNAKDAEIVQLLNTIT